VERSGREEGGMGTCALRENAEERASARDEAGPLSLPASLRGAALVGGGLVIITPRKILGFGWDGVGWGWVVGAGVRVCGALGRGTSGGRAMSLGPGPVGYSFVVGMVESLWAVDMVG